MTTQKMRSTACAKKPRNVLRSPREPATKSAGLWPLPRLTTPKGMVNHVVQGVCIAQTANEHYLPARIRHHAKYLERTGQGLSWRLALCRSLHFPCNHFDKTFPAPEVRADARGVAAGGGNYRRRSARAWGRVYSHAYY